MKMTPNIRKVYKIDGVDREFATHGEAIKHLAFHTQKTGLQCLRKAHCAYQSCLEDYHRTFGMLEESKLSDGEIKERWKTYCDFQGWVVQSKSTGRCVLLVEQIPMDTREGLHVLRVVVRYRLREFLREMSNDLRSYKMRIKECDRELAKYLQIRGERLGSKK